MTDLNPKWKATTSENEIIQKLVEWGTNREDLGAMLWTSTRTNPGAPCERFARITQYEDGLKIDFSVWPIELLSKVVADPVLPDFLDIGYKVLVDKDNLTEGIKPPTYRAFIPSPPDEAIYQDVIGEFFHEATSVAKHLWRGDLIPAKYNLDFMMIYDLLRRMLEWQMEIDHNWDIKLGAYGKGLKKWVRPEIWVELERCFTGANIEENWVALYKTIDLFRKVSVEVSQHLGYTYQYELDRRVVQYLHSVENLDRLDQSISSRIWTTSRI